ncbi:MAG: ribbon-helix-helix protein, CopG family [Deltaproteobacteria bacterium]|nr:ribbon-helix-helix protein, CopG family [Deltaproteobacteria bacterium]
MSNQAIQVSIDPTLLSEIDRHCQGRRRGRSAFIRQAVRTCLDLERSRQIDGAYRRGYGGRADEIWNEMAPLLEGQRWPAE